MAPPRISGQMASLLQADASLFAFFTESRWAQRSNQPGIADFVVGNPHEAPLPAFTAALQRWSVPQSNDWFAYKRSEENARLTVAASLRETHNAHFKQDDIFMTNGGMAAIAVALKAVVDLGDEVMFVSPPWFFYETLITATGAVPIRVQIDLDSFDLDLHAIEAAITSRTRAIIINSPNNPTGKIYPQETLAGLARVLADGSERNGRAIYLLSDEAYHKIVFDDRPFHSPTSFYPDSFLLYTYGKMLLTLGQRLGYIALPPLMSEREQLRIGIMMAQFVTGYAFPNALLQHALPDLEKLSIDIPHLERKRDRMVTPLREMGYPGPFS